MSKFVAIRQIELLKGVTTVPFSFEGPEGIYIGISLESDVFGLIVSKESFLLPGVPFFNRAEVAGQISGELSSDNIAFIETAKDKYDASFGEQVQEVRYVFGRIDVSQDEYPDLGPYVICVFFKPNDHTEEERIYFWQENVVPQDRMNERVIFIDKSAFDLKEIETDVSEISERKKGREKKRSWLNG